MSPNIVRAMVGGVVSAVCVVGLSAQSAPFRSGVDLVNVGVMVFDKQGRFIKNLTARDFEIYEEGQKQTIRFFAAGDENVTGDATTPGTAPNLRLGLLFDTSGSMYEDIELARTAAVKFFKSLPEAEDITLVDFDTEVRVARFGQADLPRLIERIRQKKPDGLTALYDALGIYLDGAYEIDGRKVLVLYTDGGDTRSALNFQDTMKMLRASDVTVYTVGFLEHQPASVRNQQRLELEQLADSTGGQAFFPTSTKMLDAIFQGIAAQVRATYSLGFVSSNTRQDGTWRKVEVRLVGDRLQSLRIRSRKGYYAPLASAIGGQRTGDW